MPLVEILLSGQFYAAALLTGALYALVATGLNLVYGTMRLLNVAHGELVMVGAYGAYVLSSAFGVAPHWSLFMVTGLAAALGGLFYLGLLQRFLRNSSGSAGRRDANSLIAFFGISIVLQNSAALAFTATPRSYPYLNSVVTFADVSLTISRLIALAVASASVLLVILFFRFSNVGLAIRAIIQNRDAASIVGMDVPRIYLFSACLGFGLAGLAGVLISMFESVQPFMGLPITISAFVVIIMGGLGNLMGGLVAGLLLGVLETFGVALVGPGFRSILVYGVFVLILLVRPQGLFGRWKGA
jgi:branched-chain amino acid transport system permease protein